MKRSYTQFGMYFSKLRKERKQSISEAAKLLGVSVAYISSVEHGDREIPQSWMEKIISTYKLNEAEIDMLNDAYFSTPSMKRVSLSEIELSLINMIDNLCEGEMREKLINDLKIRLNKFRE